jgi:hypothetical protein
MIEFIIITYFNDFSRILKIDLASMIINIVSSFHNLFRALCIKD